MAMRILAAASMARMARPALPIIYRHHHGRALLSTARQLGSSASPGGGGGGGGASVNAGATRIPAMGDIDASSDSVAAFNARQAAHRKKLVEEKKAREARTQAEALEKEPHRKAGPLTNLIYGTKEGRIMDAQIEASFSAVLARGKYVHSIVFHTVRPEAVEEYVALTADWYPKVAAMPELKMHLVGSWRTEVGDCDTFVHIWEYPRYQGYHEATHAISKLPGHTEFRRKLARVVTKRHTSLMQEFSFWPTTPPRHLGGIFELRSYTLHPGNLLEWETHWRRGLRARREVMEGVGAWFVQIGDLNTVHHLWQFANLEERKIRREKSWQIEGWSETVHKTVPLIQAMKSRILLAMPWSPTK